MRSRSLVQLWLPLFLVCAVLAATALAECTVVANALLQERTTEVQKSSVYVHYHQKGSFLSVYSNYAPARVQAAQSLAPCDFRNLKAAAARGLIETVNDAIEQSVGERPVTAANANDVKFLFGHDLFGKGGQPVLPIDRASKKFVVFGHDEKPVTLPLVANEIRGPPNAPPAVPFLARWQDAGRDTLLFFPIAGADHGGFETLHKLAKATLTGKKFILAATDLGQGFNRESRRLVPELVRFDKVDTLLVPNAVTVLIGHSPDGITLEMGDNSGVFKTIDELAKAALKKKAILIAVTCKSAAAQAAVGVFDEFQPISAVRGYRAATKNRDLLTFLDTFARGTPNADDGSPIRLLLNPRAPSLEDASIDATFDVVAEGTMKIAFQDAGYPARNVSSFVVGTVRVVVP